MNIVYLIVAMALVTYIPRMLPLILLQNVQLPAYIRRFMGFIPYAALGALIFPGVITSAGTGGIESAIAGALLALVLAWFEFNLILVVLGGIAGTFLMNMTLI